MKFFEKIASAMFPDRCVGCSARGLFLCTACMKKIPPAPSASHAFITSIFSYRDFRIKRLIWLLKYKHARHIAGVFAPALAGALVEFLGEEGIFWGDRSIVLVPIPLSKKRYQKRGYNQASLLAIETAKILQQKKISVDTKLLKKIRETTPQADIKKRSERLSNLGDCFALFPERTSRGEVIVLIDDVTTTGATLIAARTVLGRGGFHKVYALTVAH